MPLTLSADTYKKLLIPFSFVLMCLVAYAFDPKSFLEAWKGRLFYLFFLWLFTLEFILGGKNSETRITGNKKWTRMLLGALLLLVPFFYVTGVYMFGLNEPIMAVGKSLGLQNFFLTAHWPLSVEYLIITISILMGVFVLLGVGGVKQFSVSIFLLGMIGVFYMIDTFRPYATASFPNFLLSIPSLRYSISIQSLVPLTSSAVALVLRNLGHTVQMIVLRQDGGVQLFVSGVPQVFLVYWPCAGIHSLFIYTFVILLFLKGTRLSLVGKAICLAIGAVGTFFVNVLRIVSIIEMYELNGPSAGDYFHNYYGELFFLVWIVVYLCALLFVQWALMRRSSGAELSVEETPGRLQQNVYY